MKPSGKSTNGAKEGGCSYYGAGVMDRRAATLAMCLLHNPSRIELRANHGAGGSSSHRLGTSPMPGVVSPQVSEILHKRGRCWERVLL